MAIPSSEDYEDFYTIVQNALEMLSKTERRSVVELIKDINTAFIDRLEFRIISNISEDGKLPIEYASDCLEGLKDLILYAACAEQSAKPICFRATDMAKSYLNKLRLAQTEKGSFILNVDIKVVDEKDEQVIMDDFEVPTPFEHKVIQRIGTAIEQIDLIVKNERQLTETAETAYESGITANMCDALMKLRPTSDSDKIATTIRYASAITKKTGEKQSVDIEAKHFLVIDELSRIYRDKVCFLDVTLTGIVRALARKDDIAGEIKTIKLCTPYEGNMRTVSMTLSDEQYRIACDAHKEGYEVVVSGELDMSDRLWSMDNITDFRIKIEED